MSASQSSKSLLAAAAVLASIGWPGNILAQTENENFDSSPGDWVFSGPARNYGFRNSNNTEGTSGSGEAGGTFFRDAIRTTYGDVTLGGRISQTGAFSASGELSVGNPIDPDHEMLIGHHEKDFAGLLGDSPQPGARNAAGIYISQNDSNTFLWTMRMYTDNPNKRRTTPSASVASFAEARRFTYAYDPTTRELTGSILDAAGQVIGTSVTLTTIEEDDVFSADSFGLVTGHAGGANEELTFDVFIDGLTYSRAVSGDFNGDQSTKPEDFDLLRAEIRKPAAETDDRMFDINDDAATTLADRDALLTAINRKLGDTDLDGDVDLADLGNLATGFQQAGATWGRGDSDLDFDVDLNDLGNLASNFQAGRASALAAFEALVPEPASLSLLVLGSAAIVGRRRG